MNPNPLWYLTSILALIFVVLLFIEAVLDFMGKRRARDTLSEINFYGICLTFTVLFGACVWELAAS